MSEDDGWQCTALEQCGIFFLCNDCFRYRQLSLQYRRPHHHWMRRINSSQRTKPKEGKLLEDASVEYAPEEGKNMALADGISISFETERPQATDLDHKLKDSERNSLLLKERRGKSAQRRTHVKPPD